MSEKRFAIKLIVNMVIIIVFLLINKGSTTIIWQLSVEAELSAYGMKMMEALILMIQFAYMVICAIIITLADTIKIDD